MTEELERYLRDQVAEWQREADRTTGGDHSYAEGRRDACADILQRCVACHLSPPSPKHGRFGNK